jgi:hypothetical protein
LGRVSSQLSWRKGISYGQRGQFFSQEGFLHEQQVENRKKNIGVGAKMEGKFWSILGAED